MRLGSISMGPQAVPESIPLRRASVFSEALWDRESGYYSLRPYDNWGNCTPSRIEAAEGALPSGVHIVPVYHFVYSGVGTPPVS